MSQSSILKLGTGKVGAEKAKLWESWGIAIYMNVKRTLIKSKP